MAPGTVQYSLPHTYYVLSVSATEVRKIQYIRAYLRMYAHARTQSMKSISRSLKVFIDR